MFLILETHLAQGDNREGLQLEAGHVLHGGGLGAMGLRGGEDGEIRFYVRGGGDTSLEYNALYEEEYSLAVKIRTNFTKFPPA